MALFPVHSNFQGDFVIQRVPVDSDDTMDQIAQKCAYHWVSRRVAPQPDKVMRVRKHGSEELYPRAMKVGDSDIEPTAVVDIVFADA